jgi:hypothetical protein
MRERQNMDDLRIQSQATLVLLRRIARDSKKLHHIADSIGF